MRKTLVAALVAAFVVVGCSDVTAPSRLTPATKPVKLEVCRSGWTITAGDKPDSTYTGCTE